MTNTGEHDTKGRPEQLLSPGEAILGWALGLVTFSFLFLSSFPHFLARVFLLSPLPWLNLKDSLRSNMEESFSVSVIGHAAIDLQKAMGGKKPHKTKTKKHHKGLRLRSLSSRV